MMALQTSADLSVRCFIRVFDLRKYSLVNTIDYLVSRGFVN